ncbi:helix-turn-helix domain-containing protein [Pseudomonas indica]|uniref:helix-turn-helix domain-containing protein n=1 Tax=Pseudomonas indica TaxID=137658 RepID=UPI0023F95F27|nr:helix-turn-helix domain-containing protein [Pseudomonas indica]MBU3055841.1 helix-turn-helix domain-containing protein [Pseudomonas indica]
MTTDIPRLYRVNEAARLLGASRGTLYALMKAGKLAWVPFGADRRIPAAEVQRLATHGTTEGVGA